MRVSLKSFAAFFSSRRFFHRMRPPVVCLALAAFTWQLVSAVPAPMDFESEPPAAAVKSAAIPAGYILPVQLEHTLSVQKARAGDAITARVMQEVPLPNRGKIPFRSVVKGSVLNVTRDEDETGVQLTLRFDTVSGRGGNLAVVTSLRAIASQMAVHEAEMPRAAYDEQTPLTWATTYQIGGDQRFGDGGSVRNRWQETVGKAVRGGVLVHAKANPERGCQEPIAAEDHPQAFWLFSADACGVYGMRAVQLIRDGEGSPLGEITLHFKKATMKLSAGTAILLRVISAQ